MVWLLVYQISLKLAHLFIVWCEEEKCKENQMSFRVSYVSHELLGIFLSNLVCKVLYMKALKYVDLVQKGATDFEL